jgi:hypothetical protein
MVTFARRSAPRTSPAVFVLLYLTPSPFSLSLLPRRARTSAVTLYGSSVTAESMRSPSPTRFTRKCQKAAFPQHFACSHQAAERRRKVRSGLAEATAMLTRARSRS